MDTVILGEFISKRRTELHMTYDAGGTCRKNTCDK